MTTVTFQSDVSNLFRFFWKLGGTSVYDVVNLEPLENQPDRLVLYNSVEDVHIIVTGTGLSYPLPTDVGIRATGTVTGLQVVTGLPGAQGPALYNITDWSVDLDTLLSTISNLFFLNLANTSVLLVEILNANGPLTIQAEGSGIINMNFFGNGFFDVGEMFYSLLTQPVLIDGPASLSGIYYGGGGDDRLTLSGSADHLVYVSAGDDLIEITDGMATGLELDYGSLDAGLTLSLDGATGAGSVVKPSGTDTLANLQSVMEAGVLTIVGSSFDDTITVQTTASQGARLLGGRGDDMIFGGAGNDTIETGSGNDTVDGGAGDDLIVGQFGYYLLMGGDGDDVVRGWLVADNLFGGAGNDTLIGEMGFDRLFGEDGDDLLEDFSGFGGFFGGAGNDTLRGGGNANTFFGQSGDDLIEAGGGNDRIGGNAGFDTIDSGTGNDTIFGDFNADTFVFTDGHGVDVVADFDALNTFEKIDLSGISAINDLSDLDLGSGSLGAATQEGMAVFIDTGGGNLIMLLNVSLSDLDASDFIF